MTITATMPKPPEYLHFATQTLALRQCLATAIAAIPSAHLLRPVKTKTKANRTSTSKIKKAEALALTS